MSSNFTVNKVLPVFKTGIGEKTKNTKNLISQSSAVQQRKSVNGLLPPWRYIATREKLRVL